MCQHTHAQVCACSCMYIHTVWAATTFIASYRAKIENCIIEACMHGMAWYNVQLNNTF